MVTKGFRYEFTPRELWYKLFKKKVCPICGNKLTKHKIHEMRKGKDAERTRNGAFFTEMPKSSAICTTMIVHNATNDIHYLN